MLYYGESKHCSEEEMKPVQCKMLKLKFNLETGSNDSIELHKAISASKQLSVFGASSI